MLFTDTAIHVPFSIVPSGRSEVSSGAGPFRIGKGQARPGSDARTLAYADLQDSSPETGTPSAPCEATASWSGNSSSGRRLMGRKSDYAFTNLSILGIWHTVRAQDRNERFCNFRIADDSGRVVNFIKHKVLILILPTHSADVIAIARSQPGGRSIRSILSNHPTVEENKS